MSFLGMKTAFRPSVGKFRETGQNKPQLAPLAHKTKNLFSTEKYSQEQIIPCTTAKLAFCNCIFWIFV